MFQILVVEDDAELNRTVCAYLNQNGYKATGCLNASDAYDAMYAVMYDLIISDIMMPEIDGFDFAKTVRGLNSEIPILFMTARDDMTAKQRGYRIGIDDYVVKPFDPDELLLRVGDLLFAVRDLSLGFRFTFVIVLPAICYFLFCIRQLSFRLRDLLLAGRNLFPSTVNLRLP